MKRQQVDKHLCDLVAIIFKESWFNEATQSWVDEDQEYIGVLNRCECPNQEKYYVLDSEEWLPTHNACWSANRMKRIITIKKVEEWLK